MYPHRTYLVNNTFKYQMNKSSQQPILQWQKQSKQLCLHTPVREDYLPELLKCSILSEHTTINALSNALDK